MNWKRFVLPVLASVLFVTVLAEPSAVGKIGRGIAVALKMPLALLAARSPGEREPGMLRLTKGGGPEERVLPTVRDRDAPADTPGAGNPIFGNPDAFNPIAPGPSNSNALSAPDTGSRPFAPSFGPPTFPGLLIPGGSAQNSDQPPPEGPPTSTDQPPVTDNPPGSTPPGLGPEGPPVLPPPEGPITPPPDIPPGGPNPPDGPNPPGGPSPPGGPNPPDGPPPTLVIPEPATWTITGFGLLAAGLLRRRRADKKQARVTAK
jgi:hypothetical protein